VRIAINSFPFPSSDLHISFGSRTQYFMMSFLSFHHAKEQHDVWHEFYTQWVGEKFNLRKQNVAYQHLKSIIKNNEKNWVYKRKREKFFYCVIQKMKLCAERYYCLQVSRILWNSSCDFTKILLRSATISISTSQHVRSNVCFFAEGHRK
jgi:hypothetical protein